MERFQHHPDSKVIVENTPALYIDTVDNFKADCSTLKLPSYGGLQADRIGEQYIPKGRHFSHCGGDSQHEPTLKPKTLQTYIAAAAKLVEVQAARVQAAATAVYEDGMRKMREHQAAEARRQDEQEVARRRAAGEKLAGE